MNARYYIPGLGRFLTADTLIPDPTNPQSHNRYSYVINNPTGLVDPTGHCYVAETDYGDICVRPVEKKVPRRDPRGFWYTDTVTTYEVGPGRGLFPDTFVNRVERLMASYILSGNERFAHQIQQIVGEDYYYGLPWPTFCVAGILFSGGCSGVPGIADPFLVYGLGSLAASAFNAVAQEAFSLLGSGNIGSNKISLKTNVAQGATAGDRTLSPNARTTTDSQEIFRRVEKYHGIPQHVASERLHQIKRQTGRPGDANVLFDLTGNVYDPVTKEWLGSLTSGGTWGP